MKRFWIYGFALIFSGSLYAQGLPNTAFPTLKFSPSARLAALGTNFATFSEANIDIAVSNSSLISPTLNHVAMLHYANYFSAYSNIQAAYTRDIRKFGAFLASLQYVNFGSAEMYDEYGTYLGPSNRFYDAVLNLGWGKVLVDSMFSIGANFKYIFSRGENFSRNGIAVDVSGTYTNTEKRFTASLAFRNIGTVLKQDMISDYEKMPFEIDLAVYHRLQHAPFAFSLVLANLQKWNLSDVNVNEETTDPLTGEITKPNKLSTFADNAMRHVIPAIEFLPLRNFAFRLSYNYQRRKELLTDTRPGFVGFSWGIGAKIYKFQVDYARSTYHLAGAPNYISISTNLSNFNL